MVGEYGHRIKRVDKMNYPTTGLTKLLDKMEFIRYLTDIAINLYLTS